MVWYGTSCWLTNSHLLSRSLGTPTIYCPGHVSFCVRATWPRYSHTHTRTHVHLCVCTHSHTNRNGSISYTWRHFKCACLHSVTWTQQAHVPLERIPVSVTVLRLTCSIGSWSTVAVAGRGSGGDIGVMFVWAVVFIYSWDGSINVQGVVYFLLLWLFIFQMI